MPRRVRRDVDVLTVLSDVWAGSGLPIARVMTAGVFAAWGLTAGCADDLADASTITFHIHNESGVDIVSAGGWSEVEGHPGFLMDPSAPINGSLCNGVTAAEVGNILLDVVTVPPAGSADLTWKTNAFVGQQCEADWFNGDMTCCDEVGRAPEGRYMVSVCASWAGDCEPSRQGRNLPPRVCQTVPVIVDDRDRAVHVTFTSEHFPSVGCAADDLAQAPTLRIHIHNRSAFPIELPVDEGHGWLRFEEQLYTPGHPRLVFLPASDGTIPSTLCGDPKPEDVGDIPLRAETVPAGADFDFAWRTNAFTGLTGTSDTGGPPYCVDVERVHWANGYRMMVCARLAGVTCPGTAYPPLVCPTLPANFRDADRDVDVTFTSEQFPNAACP